MLVSVLIPTYNQDRFIEQTIRSVINQSYENLEILVGDDSPLDSTLDIVNPFLIDNRITYYKNKTTIGRVNNYRKLLTHSKGEWVINLDGDDYFCRPTFIEEFIKFIHQNSNSNIVMLVAKHYILKNNILVNKESIYDGKEQKWYLLDGVDDFLLQYDRVGSGHLTTMYNAKIAKSIGFYQHDILTADSESIGRLSLYGKVGFLNTYTAVWRKHSANASYHSNIITFFDSFKKNDLIYEEFEKLNLSKSKSKAFLRLYDIMHARRIFGRIVYENQLAFLEEFISIIKGRNISFGKLFFKGHMLKKLLIVSFKKPSFLLLLIKNL